MRRTWDDLNIESSDVTDLREQYGDLGEVEYMACLPFWLTQARTKDDSLDDRWEGTEGETSAVLIAR